MSRRGRLVGIAVVLVAFSVALSAQNVRATSITVNTAEDIAPSAGGVFPTDGKCSLRAAMLSALNNSNYADADCQTGLGGGSFDTIQIDPSLAGQTLTLSATLGPLPYVNNAADNAFEIIGPTTNAADFVISGGDHHRVFELGYINIGSSYLTLANLTISHGNATTLVGNGAGLDAVNGSGGAIYAGENTHLTLTNVVLSANHATAVGTSVGRGGAIFVTSGTITNNGGAYVNNSATDNGGAIFAYYGPTTYTGYALKMQGNSAEKGGAIAMNADPGNAFAHIERSLLINNSATNAGGVFSGEPTINDPTTVFELTDSTVTGNTAPSGGVFFGNTSEQQFRFLRDTFNANTATSGGGLYYAGGGFIANSIVVDSTCHNSDGTPPTGSRNLWSGTTTGCTKPGDLGAVTNLSSTLAQNGGPEVQQTYALLGGSNAIDNGDQAYCGTIDARSVPRGVNGVGAVNAPQAGDCDIGAYEYAKYIVNFANDTSTVNEGGGTANVQVKLTIPDPANSPLTAALSIPVSRDPGSTARGTIDYAIPAAGVTFPAGTTSGSTVNLPVTILQDSIAERNGEFVIFHLEAAEGVAIAEPKTHNLSIQDDDQAGVLVSDGGNGTTVGEATPGTADSFSFSLQSQPDYSQPDPNDSNSYGSPADVTVTLEPDRDCTAAAGGQTATAGHPISFDILNANWQTGQTVSVNAVDDPWDEDLRDEAAPHTCTISYSFASTDPVYDATIDRYDVHVIDNDVNSVSIAVSGAGTSIVEGGATDTFTIALSTPPDPAKPPEPARAATVVTADPGPQCDVGNGPGAPKSFTFNADNWNLPQTVTVSALDDQTVELVHTCVVTNSVESGDPYYDDLSAAPAFVRTPPSVTASIQDYDPAQSITNDPPFIDVDTLGGISVSEATASVGDTFTVVLERQPLTSDVTIDLTASEDPRAPGAQVLLKPERFEAGMIAHLVFTPANWNVAQTVTVFAVNDYYDESPNLYPVTISAEVTTSAVGFNDASLRRYKVGTNAPTATLSVPVTIVDNDVSGIDVIQSGGSTGVAEGGATDAYTVNLHTFPFADVAVTVTPDRQCDLGLGAGVPVVEQFPAGEWNHVHTVTVRAVDDELIEIGAQTCTITNVATSNDGLYDNLAGPNVVASIADNDFPYVLLTTGNGLAVSEAAATSPDTFMVALHSKPDANVVVDLAVADGQTRLSAGGSEASSSIHLTFTPASYSVGQTVSVYAVDDAIDEATPHAGAIGLDVTTTAAGYSTAAQFKLDGATVTAVPVSVADNDAAGVTLTVGNTNIAEGGATGSYGITLESQPAADVTISVNPGSQCTVSGAPVVFTAANWSTQQSVTVTAVDDQLVEPSAVSCDVSNSISSSDSNYAAIGPTFIPFYITDNDSAGVLITAPQLALDEGNPSATVTYSVVLAGQPGSNVVVDAIAQGGQATFSPGGGSSASLTFTPANWDAPQTLTVAVADDTIPEASPHEGIIAHGVSSDAYGYDTPSVRISVNGGTDSLVRLAITDNDEPTPADDAATTNEDTALDIDVLANDVNPASSDLAIDSFDATSANGGSIAAGSGKGLRYTPPTDFNGTDTFTYKATNGLVSGPVTVTVTVNAVNDPPTFTAGGDVVSPFGSPYSAAWATAVVAGPPDESGQHVSFVVTAVGDPGLFAAGPAIDGSGVLTFTPAAGTFGTSSVTVHATDDGGTANGGVADSADVTFAIAIEEPSLGSPTVTLTQSSETSSIGAAVTYTATIDPYPGGGILEFFDGDNLITDDGCSASPILAPGRAVCTVTYGEPGQHSISARFLGYAGYDTSESPSITHHVLIGTTTTISGPATGLLAQTLTFTATVSPDPAGGRVEFYDGNALITTSGCNSPVVGPGGTATCTTAFNVAGAHAVSARFVPSAGASQAPSSSTALAVQVTYVVSVLTQNVTVVAGRSTVITVALLDANGLNVSTSAAALTVTGAAPSWGKLDGNFTFVAAKRNSPAYYTYTLVVPSTATARNYRLNFTISSGGAQIQQSSDVTFSVTRGRK